MVAASERWLRGFWTYTYGFHKSELVEMRCGPATLAGLAINREKKTRALFTALGIKPEHAAVSLTAAKEALLAAMPDKAHAITQTELFEKAGVVTKRPDRKP